MMARIAEALADQSGSLLTAGSGVAYTISTNQIFDTLAHLSGQRLKLRFHTGSGGSATLNVDGLGAKALQVAQGVAATVGGIQANSIWDVTYDNAIPAFIISGGFGSAATPVGATMDFAGTSAPLLWLLCFGQAVSRTSYAALFTVLGTAFGVGDGSTTFNVPDCRGRIAAGKDDMGGSAAGRISSVVTDNGTITGATLGSTGGSSTHVQSNAEMNQHSHTFTGDAMPGHVHAFTGAFGAQYSGGSSLAPFVNSGSTNTGAASAGTPTGTNANSGSSNAMAWLQPTIMMNKIIFAGV